MQKARLGGRALSESVLFQVYQVEGIVRPGFSQANYLVLCGLETRSLGQGLTADGAGNYPTGHVTGDCRHAPP